MKVRMCDNQGNRDIQTKLVHSLQRDITNRRRAVQNSLARQLTIDIKKYRTVEDHFSQRKKALIDISERTKESIDEKEDYYVSRGNLSLDMAYTETLYKLNMMEEKIMQQLDDVKKQNQKVLKELELLEHRMAVRKSTCHFFKCLYESDPAKPVGETLDMLRSEHTD